MSSDSAKDVTYQRITEVLLRSQSVNELAADFNVTRQTIHAWRTGRRPNPKQRQQLVDRIISLAETLSPRVP